MDIPASASMATDEPSAAQPREKILAVLLQTYRAKQRLRKADKDKIKMIKSLQQGYDGTVARCCFCKQLGKCDTDLQLHHIDYTESHNMLENLEPAHQTCNNTDHANHAKAISKKQLNPSMPSSVSERENTSRASAFEATNKEGQEWTSREGEKHDQMRHKWNAWINDLERGPFRGKSAQVPLKTLAGSAVHKLGMGSSVTYRRYIMEDYYGNILDIFVEEDGRRYVRLIAMPATEEIT